MNPRRRRSVTRPCIAMMVLCLCSASGFSRAEPVAAMVDTSDRLIGALRANEPAALEPYFDDALRSAAPHERVVEQWEALAAHVGALGPCETGVPSTRGAIAIVEYRCMFARAPMTIRFAWTDRGRLAGYFFVASPVATPLPAGATEVLVTTGAPGWPLPASLVLPKSPVRPPVVVFVHGSGPQDRDETIGPNKPFRDLAYGLAARGVASLRYDKRTFVHGDRFRAERPNWTLDDQIVDDAVAAIRLAQSREDLGPLFIVGHSEGAWLAPRIAATATSRGARVAGVVMLEANLTPLAVLLVEQFAFAAQGANPRVTAAMLEEEKVKRDHVAALVAAASRGPLDLDSSPVARQSLPLGMPASAWLDIAHYDPAVALLAQPRLPALLAFGQRDFQVPIREKALWESRLGARGNTTLVAFSDLNHLLIEGSGPMSATEYARPGHVAQTVIGTVVAWIAAIASASS